MLATNRYLDLMGILNLERCLPAVAGPICRRHMLVDRPRQSSRVCCRRTTARRWPCCAPCALRSAPSIAARSPARDARYDRRARLRFDAYGTLFDFASAAAGCADVLGDKAAAVTALWRDKQLHYTWLRGTAGAPRRLLAVTGDALDFTLETLGTPTRTCATA